MSLLLWLTGVGVVAGPVMIIRGVAGRAATTRELSEQEITFPGTPFRTRDARRLTRAEKYF